MNKCFIFRFNAVKKDVIKKFLIKKRDENNINMTNRNITNLIKKVNKENLYPNINLILNLFEMNNITGNYIDFL